MKHKPILMKKIEIGISKAVNNDDAEITSTNDKPDKLNSNVIIAVVGADRCCGCTHTAITISAYLARKNNKVAILECSKKNDFMYLNKKYNDDSNLRYFRHKNIDFYENDISLISLLNKKTYNFIVLDIGQLKDTKGDIINAEYYKEVLRAQLTILVSGSKPWQLTNMMSALYADSDFKDNNDTREWRLYLTFTSDKVFESIKIELNEYEIFQALYRPQLFINDQEQDSLIRKLLQPVLKEKNNIYKKFF